MGVMDIKDYWNIMKNWRIVQDLFHRLNPHPEGDRSNIEIKISESIAEDAIKHFYEYVPDFIYPAKSYFVAICYASWIAKDFNEDFYELLDDKMLLAGNDPYFVPYSQSKQEYDEILKHIEINNIKMSGMVPDVREYYEQEFAIWLQSNVANTSISRKD